MLALLSTADRLGAGCGPPVDFEGEKENEPKPDEQDDRLEEEGEEPDDEVGEVDEDNQDAPGAPARILLGPFGGGPGPRATAHFR